MGVMRFFPGAEDDRFEAGCEAGETVPLVRRLLESMRTESDLQNDTKTARFGSVLGIPVLGWK